MHLCHTKPGWSAGSHPTSQRLLQQNMIITQINAGILKFAGFRDVPVLHANRTGVDPIMLLPKKTK